MSGSRGTRRQIHVRFWRGNLKIRDQLEDLEKDGRIILKYIVRKVDWVRLAQSRHEWLPLANKIINVRVS
jgi:hypothetical protein